MDEIKTNTLLIKDVKLVLDENLDENEVFASTTLNPHVAWIKFVLTDDKPNGNGHRIPVNEFDNIIRTGRFMPLKSAEGSISLDHKDSKPLGVITHLQKENNTVVGLAALWIKERKDDIAKIKEKFSSKDGVHISWELSHKDSIIEGGVETLTGIVMDAATIVGIPAYQGRTPVVQMASLQTTEETMETIELEKHEQIVNELKQELETTKSSFASLEEELESLRQFKTEIEEQRAYAERFDNLKSKFETAGLKPTETYLKDNETKFMAMSEEVLDFFIQELVAFASKEEADANKEASLTTSQLPNIDATKVSKTHTTKSLAEELREYDAK